MDAGSRIRHNYTTSPDSGCTLAVTAITGRNQNASGSDPACLLGQFYCMFLISSDKPFIHSLSVLRHRQADPHSDSLTYVIIATQ